MSRRISVINRIVIPIHPSVVGNRHFIFPRPGIPCNKPPTPRQVILGPQEDQPARIGDFAGVAINALAAAAGTLGEVERQILGLGRTQEEVPGYLVPQIYVDYLKSGDARPLAGVFYHNAMDVLSLAGLFTHTAALLDDPQGFSELPGLDLVALAHLFEELEHYDDAVSLYALGLGRDIPEEHFWKTVMRYALLYKRRGEWEKAVALWEKAAGHGDVAACIELAKYYEHRVEDYQ
jgi:tetratricopeptide (TPR) repeat protein